MRLLSKKDVCARTTYSRAHLDRLEAEGRFPKRVRLGRARVAWVEDEVDEWIAERVAERDGST